MDRGGCNSWSLKESDITEHTKKEGIRSGRKKMNGFLRILVKKIEMLHLVQGLFFLG